jgi:hypothetical protein
MMDGRSFSSVESVPPAAAPSALLSMLNGSIVGAAAAGAGADGAASALNQDGDVGIVNDV